MLKGTPWKWLDLPALFAKVLQPHHDILRVKYFTARVSSTPADPSKPQRQDVYLRALQHYRPEVEVYFGHFLSHRVRMPLARPVGNPRTAEVIKTEERGSDVNLAVHLLNDCWLYAYDCAVVVSNDSDLAETMRVVRGRHPKLIGLMIPGSAFVRSTQGELGLHEANPGERPSEFAITGPDPRHQHPQTGAVVE